MPTRYKIRSSKDISDAKITVINNTTGTNSGDQTITLTGDVTGSGTGSFAATLATVNSNVGTFGSATKASAPVVNGKGLVTAITETTVTPAVGSITGLGTGVATALAINTGSAGAHVVFNGAGGTPSSIDLTNATNTPAGAVGSITGLGTGVATALGVNVGSAGAFITFNGNAGTPSALVATNASGTAASLTAGHVTTNANLTGDVTSSGNATTIASDAVTTVKILDANVTLAKMANIATDSLIGRATASSGVPEVLTALPFAFTGDVTRAADSNAQSIATDAVTTAKILDANVTLSKMANIATDSILGRATASSGVPEVLTALPFAYTGDVTRAADSNTTVLANIPAIAGTNLTGTAASLTAGNATKWTTGRTIALTGDVTYTSGSLDGSGNVTGTATLANIPAIAGTNLTGTGASFTAGNATKWTTGRTVALTGDVTYTSGSLDGSGNVTGTAAVVNVPAAATHEQAINTIPTNTGGWTEYFVTGSNVNISTTSGTGDVVTGLTTGSLSNSTKYEFEVTLHVVNAADANGMKFTINGGGSGSTLIAHFWATTTAAAVAQATLNTIDTLSAAFVTATSIPGVVTVHGFFVTGATAAAVNVKCAKVTGNTATVNIGSTFRVRKAHT